MLLLECANGGENRCSESVERSEADPAVCRVDPNPHSLVATPFLGFAAVLATGATGLAVVTLARSGAPVLLASCHGSPHGMGCGFSPPTPPLPSRQQRYENTHPSQRDDLNVISLTVIKPQKGAKVNSINRGQNEKSPDLSRDSVRGDGP